MGALTVSNPDGRIWEAFQGGQGNADLALTGKGSIEPEHAYMVVNGGNWLRNVLAVIAYTGKSVTAALGGSILKLVVGPVYMATGAAWTIPDAWHALKDANKELEEAKRPKPEEVLYNNGKLDENEQTKRISAQNKVHEAEKNVAVGQLGVINQGFYFNIGAVLTAGGITDICLASAASLAGLSTASLALTAVLGALYTVRAPIMGGRAYINLDRVQEFKRRFLEALDKMEFMKNEQEKGASYLGNRVDSSCMIKSHPSGHQFHEYTVEGKVISKRWMRISKDQAFEPQYIGDRNPGYEVMRDDQGTYITSNSIDMTNKKTIQQHFSNADDILKCIKEDKKDYKKKHSRDEIHAYTKSGFMLATQFREKYGIGEELEYLERVHKGIYTAALKHKTSMLIAAAMLIGGIATILSIVLTGGLSLLAIGVIAAIFFIIMEYTFLTYDSSRMFEWFRDWRYSKQPNLQEASEAAQTDSVVARLNARKTSDAYIALR
jgi:hypothetical protein